MRMKQLICVAGATCAAGMLSACVDVQKPLLPDHGVAFRAAVAAQIADPEARYERKVEPASNAIRAVAATERYNKDQVTQPISQSTSSVGGGGGGGGSTGGSGGSR